MKTYTRLTAIRCSLVGRYSPLPCHQPLSNPTCPINLHGQAANIALQTVRGIKIYVSKFTQIVPKAQGHRVLSCGTLHATCMAK